TATGGASSTAWRSTAPTARPSARRSAATSLGCSPASSRTWRADAARAGREPGLPPLARDASLAAPDRQGAGAARLDARAVRAARVGVVAQPTRAAADPGRARRPGRHRCEDDVPGRAEPRGQGADRTGGRSLGYARPAARGHPARYAARAARDRGG